MLASASLCCVSVSSESKMSRSVGKRLESPSGMMNILSFEMVDLSYSEFARNMSHRNINLESIFFLARVIL
jgi:amino acid permease